MIMNEKYAEVISALTELQGWLKDSKGYYSQIGKIISDLGKSDLKDFQKRKIKHELSHEMLFHIKCLGDIYVKDFPSDGTGSPWLNYLDRICRLCQEKMT